MYSPGRKLCEFRCRGHLKRYSFFFFWLKKRRRRGKGTVTGEKTAKGDWKLGVKNEGKKNKKKWG